MKLKPKSYKVLGWFIFALAIMYGVTSAGFADLRGYFYTATALALGLLVLVESSWTQYLNTSRYKSLNAQDIFGLIGSIAGGMIIVSSVLSIPMLAAATPVALLNFFGAAGTIIAVVVAINAVILILTD